jgi:hypothetical protein
MASFLRSLPAVPPLASPFKRGGVSVPAFHRGFQPFDKSRRGFQVLSCQRSSHEDALDRFREVQPRPSKRRIQKSDPPIPAPPYDLGTVMAFQIVQNQDQPHRRRRLLIPPELHRVFLPAPIRPLPTQRGWVCHFRQGLQDRGKLLLHPRMEDGIRRLLHPFRTNFAGLRMKQRQQLGGATPDVLAGSDRGLSFRLPRGSRLRDRLIRSGFILIPDGDAPRLSLPIRLLDQPLLASARRSVTSTVSPFCFRLTLPVSHHVRVC